MWMSVKLLESVLKLASIDLAPTNATASTATKRSVRWEILIMHFSNCLSISILMDPGPGNRAMQGARGATESDICSQDRHAQARPGQVEFWKLNLVNFALDWIGKLSFKKNYFGLVWIGKLSFKKIILDWFGLAGWTWSQFWTQAPDRRAPSTTTSKAEHSSGSSQLQLQLGRNDKLSGRMWWRRRSTRYLLLEGRGLFLSSTTTIHHDTVHHDTVHRDTVHHDTVHHDTNIIPLVPRSVVVEEGVVTADGLAVDWVLLSHSPSPWSAYR